MSLLFSLILLAIAITWLFNGLAYEGFFLLILSMVSLIFSLCIALTKLENGKGE